ncbi:hypothetical protein M1L60_00995 [Actinoplanes sp. TRM 88003]|uniref:histidine kinase n=1 Tax=Paractinoplanes aksuensis TaxID=2939490 RepID=A0ABT1DEB3_9ACTN|nr:histidine kinase dimerization/phospho-acceptor domain-containing protein [Actinoplanes aksuensis]MCO8269161.1 hypothetical protein [Actinoplanes aksuensis]
MLDFSASSWTGVLERAQRTLVEDAGHELRTPLTSTRTNVELLLEVERRPAEAHRLPPVERAALLAEVVTAAVSRVRTRAPAVTFVTELTPAVVTGRPGELERMVVNVLDNAAKWSPPGGTVQARLTGDRDRWTLRITDDGSRTGPK